MAPFNPESNINSDAFITQAERMHPTAMASEPLPTLTNTMSGGPHPWDDVETDE